MFKVFSCPAKVHDLKFAIPWAKAQKSAPLIFCLVVLVVMVGGGVVKLALGVG